MTSVTPGEDERHFMDHPEVEEYLSELFPSITAESDRGAVLLGASQIDKQLRLLFDQLIPSHTSNNRKKEIFNVTGPFGGFAGKLDVAYVCRLLPKSLIDAIHRFRKLRNDVAHNASAFRLQDHRDEIYKIFSMVGPGVDAGVSRMTVDLMLENMLSRLVVLKHPIEGGMPLFEDRSAAIAYLDDHRDLLKVLEVDRPRWEVGIGIGLICGLIIYHRERLVAAIGSNETFASTIRPKAPAHKPDI